MNDYIFSVQRKIILEIAEKGPCVIVGRCADDILADYENSLHVFVYGEAEEKIKKGYGFKSCFRKGSVKAYENDG